MAESKMKYMGCITDISVVIILPDRFEQWYNEYQEKCRVYDDELPKD